MKSSAGRVKALYAGTLPPAYDDRGSLPGRLVRRVKMVTGRVLYDFDAQVRDAIQVALLSRGDRVVVFCCGTGREFAAIQERIGPEGAIVGVDFSAAMLARARQCVEREQWTNVALVQGDATEFVWRGGPPFDAAVCTLGMSIIPDWPAAWRNLLASVKGGGAVVVGDLLTATGSRALLNPVLAWWTRPYGGSRQGHANARTLFDRMATDLDNVETRTYGHGTYAYCVGRKR